MKERPGSGRRSWTQIASTSPPSKVCFRGSPVTTEHESTIFSIEEQPDVEDNDDDRVFSQINALSSPASTPPQAELPKSPDLSEKINGPSTSAVDPLPLLAPGGPERPSTYRTSASVGGVEADAMLTSPTPSVRPPSPTSITNPAAPGEPASHHPPPAQV